MSQKYNLYDILFEFDGSSTTKKAPDLKARLAAMQQKGKTEASPSGKIEMHPHQILSGMQNKIKSEIPVISKLIKDPDPSKEDIKAAKKALDDVDNSVDAIANFQGFAKEIEVSTPKEKKEEPQVKQSVNPTAKTEPQMPSMGTAKTIPQNISTSTTLPRVQTVSKTQPMSIADIRAAQGLPQKQSEIKTEPMPAQKAGFFQGLKNRFLKEAIKQAISEVMVTKYNK